MAHEREIAELLEELRSTTDRLVPDSDRVDLDRMEIAVAKRREAVARLGCLIARFPDDFSPDDLDEIRRSQSKGKRALEKIIEMRGRGWTTATHLSQSEYVLRSFAHFGSVPSADSDE